MRLDDEYGNFPLYKEITEDYENFFKEYGNVTTVQKAQEVEESGMISVMINGKEVEDYFDTNYQIRKIEFGAYGCLGNIVFEIKKNQVQKVVFDVWCNEIDDFFIENIERETLTHELYERRMCQVEHQKNGEKERNNKMSKLLNLFKKGDTVKCRLDSKIYVGVIKEAYENHIIVDIPEISDHCRFENGVNMDCVFPKYNQIGMI